MKIKITLNDLLENEHSRFESCICYNYIQAFEKNFNQGGDLSYDDILKFYNNGDYSTSIDWDSVAQALLKKQYFDEYMRLRKRFQNNYEQIVNPYFNFTLNSEISIMDAKNNSNIDSCFFDDILNKNRKLCSSKVKNILNIYKQSIVVIFVSLLYKQQKRENVVTTENLEKEKQWNNEWETVKQKDGSTVVRKKQIYLVKDNTNETPSP